MVFKSAVDGWYYIMLALIAIALSVLVIPLMKENSVIGYVIFLLTVLLSLGFPLWLLFSTQYHVTDHELVVKSGPFSWHINRSEIHSIHPSHSLLSAPALSLDRLRIEYGQGKVILISPKNRDGFIALLAVG